MKLWRARSRQGGSSRWQASDRTSDLSRRSDTEPLSLHVCWSMTARKNRRMYFCTQRNSMNLNCRHWCTYQTKYVLLCSYPQIVRQIKLIPFLNHLVHGLQIAQSLEKRHIVCLRLQVTNQVQGFIERQMTCPLETYKNRVYTGMLVTFKTF